MRSIVACLAWAAGLGLVPGTASADTLKLANGDELTGEVVEWAVDHVVLDHPQLGRLKLGLDQLELDTGEPPNPGLFDTRFLRGWTRRFELGFNGKQGNSVSTNLTSVLRLNYEDDWTRWKVNGRYFFNRSDDGDNDNNALVELRRDWLIPDSRWFGSLGGRYQFDQFEAWKHRITVFAGPGYHLIQSERHTLDLITGPAYTREFGDVQESKMEWLLALDFEWEIWERHTFSLGNNLFVETRPDAGDIRNFTRAAWSIAIAEDPNLSLNLSVENEYDTHPDEGDDNNDLKYFLTVGVDF